jgi:hypothetical protein
VAPGSSESAMTTFSTEYDAVRSDTIIRPLAPPDGQFGLPQFLSRPVYVTSFAVPSVMVTTEINPLTLWVTSALIADKLKYYRLLSGKLHVRVELGLNPHYYGSSHICLARGVDSAQGAITPQRSMTIPGAFLDFNVCNPVELSMDLVTAGSAVDLHVSASAAYGTDTACSMLFTTFEALRRDDGVAVGTQLVKIFVWMTDVRLAGAVPYTTASGPEDAGLAGRISAAPTGVGRMLVRAAVQNVSGLLAGRASDVAARLGPLLASAMGFSRPIADIAQTRVDPSRALYLAPSIGADSSQTLSLDPAAQVTTDLSKVSAEADPLSYDFWFKAWGYVDGFQWATTDAPGAQIAVIPVTPVLANTLSPLLLTPVGFVANMFDRWSGSVKIRLHCSATPYHRGRLLVYYAPNTTTITAPSLNVVTSSTETCVLDVASGFDKTFTVRWTQPNLYADTTGALINPGSITGSSLNGTLRVMVLDPLIASVAGANLTVSVWLSGGDDLDLQAPSTVINGFYIASDSQPRAFDQAVLGTEEVVFGAFPNTADVLANTFGEQRLSLRVLLKRCTQWMLLNPNDNTSIAVMVDVMVRSQWPLSPLVKTATTSNAYAGTVGTAVTYLTPLTAIMACFSGVRGGFRHKIVSLGSQFGTNSTTNKLVSVSLPPIVAENQAWTAPTWLQPTVTSGNVTAVGLLSQDSCAGAMITNQPGAFSVLADVEVRSRLGKSYVNTTSSASGVPNEVGFIVVETFPGNGGGSTAGPQYAAYVGAAEDFNPVGFCGVPALTVGGPAYYTGNAYA